MYMAMIYSLLKALEVEGFPMIRTATLNDATPIANIYNHYIANTVVTFEEQSVCADEMSKRIEQIQRSDLPCLVAVHHGEVIGFSYASHWNGRCAYRFSAEITVYLSPLSTGSGWGSQLYEALFAELKQRSVHTVIGGIALPNAPSIALHEKFGMEKVAHFKEVGFKFGEWVDVGYWQGKLNPLAAGNGGK